ncbi:MAG: DNA mismatch repair protein MutT, partial [Chloroflexi bacterium]|nr:DNA mismatch repair protein MutT [Chloroflexota bacterium]
MTRFGARKATYRDLIWEAGKACFDSIPGVRPADLEAAARRKLREKTGVRSPYLEQLGSFGDARRDPRGWSATHVYFALLAA